jgi:osmotically-inducible protein OsmY
MRILPLVVLLAASIGCRTNETPEQQVHDAEITGNVKAKFASELGGATVTNISVNVTNGVVTLTGIVHNTEERSKAIVIAQAVPQVVRVNDNLQVVSAQAP